MKEEEKGKSKFQFSSDFDRVEIDGKKTKEVVSKDTSADENQPGWVWMDDAPHKDETQSAWVWVDNSSIPKTVTRKKKKKKPKSQNQTPKPEVDKSQKVEEKKDETSTKNIEEKPKKKTTTRKKSTTAKKSTPKKNSTRKSSTTSKKTTTKETTEKKTTLLEKKDFPLPEYVFVPDEKEEQEIAEDTVRDESIVVSESTRPNSLEEKPGEEIPTETPVEEVPTVESVEEVHEEVPKVEDEIVEEVMAAMEKRESEDETAVLSRSEIDAAMNNPKFKKMYISFQTRVVLLVLGILVLFGFACYIIVSTLQSNVIQKVGFVENSTAHYDVCISSNSPYDTNCLKEGKTYDASSASKIHVDFHYEALFDKKLNYNMSYYVVITNRIFDQIDKSKVSYEDEDVVVHKTSIPVDNPGMIDSSVEVDYQKYNRFVQEYKRKYASNVDSSLDVALFIDDGKQTRSVAKVQIPLGKDSFQVSKEIVVDEKQVYVSEVTDWSNTNTFYIVIGSVFVILSLFLLFHLTKLSLAVAGKKSKYQIELENILNEYDRLIVVARDGYESNIEKRVVKVDSFGELLDAREVLEKPIIYSKINNIKSEFIVEDEFIIYKFILKEADVEQQQQ